MERAALRAEIEELYADYAYCLDEGELERWPELFVADCLYQVIPRENYERQLPVALMHCESRGMLQDRVEALRRSSVYAPRRLRHIVSGLRIGAAADDRVEAEANYVVLETPDEEPTHVLNAGRYLDRLVRDAGVWRFQQRLCVFDSVLVPGSLVFPV